MIFLVKGCPQCAAEANMHISTYLSYAFETNNTLSNVAFSLLLKQCQEFQGKGCQVFPGAGVSGAFISTDLGASSQRSPRTTGRRILPVVVTVTSSFSGS